MWADKTAADLDALFGQNFVRFSVDDEEFDRRCAAHAIDEKQDIVAVLEGEILQNWIGSISVISSADFSFRRCRPGSP